jgi:23S rRNA pseudouridine1911/1915/1917 synthase
MKKRKPRSERVAPSLHVLYEDNHCLAVLKPAGMLTAGDRTGDVSLLDLAKQYLQRKYHKPGRVYLGLVHRLDRPVSGVVLFARTSKAAARISEQFRAGTVQKIYEAWVEGGPAHPSGTLTNTLAKNVRRNIVTTVVPGTAGARLASLQYRVVAERHGRTLLEIHPQTGRAHQIRVQLAGRGMPIVGDVKYGASPTGARAIALHAVELTFQHPVRDERITIRAPRPT